MCSTPATHGLSGSRRQGLSPLVYGQLHI